MNKPRDTDERRRQRTLPGMQTLTMNPYAIDRCLTGSDFIGFGEIRHGEVLLRSGRKPFGLRLDTLDGVIYPRFELLGIDAAADSVDLHLAAHGYADERGEYGDDYGQRLILDIGLK